MSLDSQKNIVVGVVIVVTKQKENEKLTPPKPDRPCWVCGSTEWWLRDGEWICSRCHPAPREKDKDESNED